MRRPNPPRKSLYADKADAVDLAALSIEQTHSGASQDLPDLLRMAGFTVVVAQHTDHRNGASAQLLRQFGAQRDSIC